MSSVRARHTEALRACVSPFARPATCTPGERRASTSQRLSTRPVVWPPTWVHEREDVNGVSEWHRVPKQRFRDLRGGTRSIPCRKRRRSESSLTHPHAQKTKTPTVVGVFCGGAGNRTRVREASNQLSFTCVVGLPNRRGSADSAAGLAPEFSQSRRPVHRRDPALVMTPFRYQNYLTVGRLYCFLGSESDCIVVCNWYGPILERVGCLHTQTDLQSPRRNRSPPKGCGSGQDSYRPTWVKWRPTVRAVLQLAIEVVWVLVPAWGTRERSCRRPTG
jgi:hypothetical protein